MKSLDSDSVDSKTPDQNVTERQVHAVHAAHFHSRGSCPSYCGVPSGFSCEIPSGVALGVFQCPEVPPYPGRCPVPEYVVNDGICDCPWTCADEEPQGNLSNGYGYGYGYGYGFELNCDWLILNAAGSGIFLMIFPTGFLNDWYDLGIWYVFRSNISGRFGAPNSTQIGLLPPSQRVITFSPLPWVQIGRFSNQVMSAGVLPRATKSLEARGTARTKFFFKNPNGGLGSQDWRRPKWRLFGF